MAYCGADVISFLTRRAEKGFNLLPAMSPAEGEAGFAAPSGQDKDGHLWDWVLTLSTR